MGYIIMTDATCDLPASVAEELGVTVLPMEYIVDGKSYTYASDFSGPVMKRLSEALKEGKAAVTSQINTFAFTGAFEPLLEAGHDIIFISFSSALSGQYLSALSAAKELSQRFTDRKIACVNSKCASTGEGLLVYYAARRKDELNFDQMVDYIENLKMKIVHWFTVDDLKYLKRGGRISGATAAMATILNIKPVMHVNDEGMLVSVGKVRGRKNSLKALVENIKAGMDREAADMVVISQFDAEEDAQYVAELIRAECGVDKIMMADIGPSTGVHSGPGTMALFCLGDRKKMAKQS